MARDLGAAGRRAPGGTSSPPRPTDEEDAPLGPIARASTQSWSHPMRALALLAGLAAGAALLVPSFVAGQEPSPEVKVIQTGTGKSTPLHLSFGLYQSDKATEMYRKFTPVIEAIQSDVEKRLGRPTDIEMQIYKTYEDGIEAL